MHLKGTRRSVRWVAAAAAAVLISSAPVPAAPAAATAVDGKALTSAAGDLSEWLTHGRTYDEQRFSPLEQINTGNVKDLGLAWFADLDTARGQEATPLVIDGTIYITTAWSKVKAYDAVSGKLRWQYDPKVPGEAGIRACCDVVNRGLAAWGHRLFFGTLDGRLIALERDSGKLLWSTLTVDRSKPYGISGAPRVIDGRVIIGNGGAEMGVRGYVAAYDSEDGKELWRFYTVPDRPGANTAAHLQRAESTWKGDWWTLGGGGTVWDSMAYDPKLDLLYIGTGNGTPWNQAYRSPGGGDNLYIDSIIALKPEDRGVRLALPDDTGRHLGLRCHAAHDPRGPRDRRTHAQRLDAGVQERLLLRARPRDRTADLGGQLCAGHLGEGHRPEERAAHREPRRARRPDRQALPARARTRRRTQLAAQRL